MSGAGGTGAGGGAGPGGDGSVVGGAGGGVGPGGDGSVVVAIEAGGTKFLCAAGRDRHDLTRRGVTRIATTTPTATMRAVAGWAASLEGLGPLGAVGVASFGPLDLGRRRIGSTPKSGWSGFDWDGAVRDVFPGLPFGLETDVGAAALAEHRWGAAQGRDPAVYLTVGTGIGGGIVAGGRVLHGLVHPEIGHMHVGRHESDDFPGACPFHRDCLEGMASGTALAQRWGMAGETLPAGHPAWALEAWYLARAVANLVMTLSPEVIVIGGGLMAVAGLRARVGDLLPGLIAGYVDAERLHAPAAGYLVDPGLGRLSGVLGALAVGQGAVGAGPAGRAG